MLEVFICFSSDSQAVQVLDTAERWRRTKGAYPTVIQAPEEGFEIKRRVLADKLAKDDVYLIADVLCVPAMPKFIEMVESRIKENVGLAGIANQDSKEVTPYPSGVRVCRKGVIEKWPVQETPDYNKEHAEAVSKKGKKVELWSDVIYFVLKHRKFKKTHATIH